MIICVTLQVLLYNKKELLDMNSSLFHMNKPLLDSLA